MHGLGHYLIWSIVVSVYLIEAWMLCKSEKGGLSLLGLIMLVFYSCILFDGLRVITGETSCFPFTVGVCHGTIGTVLIYGAVFWIAIIDINVRKRKD